MESDIFVIFAYIIIIGIALYLARRKKIRRKELYLANEAKLRRLADCEAVVRYFANNHGYLARSAVSREELQELIDNGISALELADFVAEKIIATNGIRLGYQYFGDLSVPVILPDQFRDKHIYIIGKSGYGKTNFIRYMISQDLTNGYGLGVLAPEFEMLNDEILPFIPDERIDDVVYFNPADLECPVVLNPLHIDKDDDIDLHVDEIFTIFSRILGEGGPRMDEILRHSLYALVEKQGTTLMDFAPLLDRNDRTLRNEIIESTKDEQTRIFFKNTYPQLPKDSHIPIINRIGRIVRARHVRNCLCPPQKTNLSYQEVSERLLNIRKAMDDSKILLFNLSDGILGDIASQLIGQLIVSKFQTATMSRADTSKTMRKPFYLYLDEFQNFCGTSAASYEKILSRARKYKLGMILAHQQTGQIAPGLLKEILGNVSTLVGFQVSQSDAARMSKEFISQYDLNIESIPAEALLRLPVGQAFCRIGKSSFPFNIPKVSDKPNREKARIVIAESRKRYGIPRIVGTEIKPEDDKNDFADPLADIDPGGVFE